MSNRYVCGDVRKQTKKTSLMMITTLPFPEQLTQIERFFLTARVNFPPQSLGCNIFRNNTQQNNKADSPRVLIIKLSHSLLCSHPDSSSTYCGAQTSLLCFCVNPTFHQQKLMSLDQNEALGYRLQGFKLFSAIDLFISSFPSLSVAPLLPLSPLTFLLFFSLDFFLF